MGNEDNDGWSQEAITIDGKEYLHKSAIPELGDLVYDCDDGSAREWSMVGALYPRVLLKPVEPEPRYPTPDKFFKPTDPNVASGILRRQLESEQRAVTLLRQYLDTVANPPRSQWSFNPYKVNWFLRARDEGLPWPEEDQA